LSFSDKKPYVNGASILRSCILAVGFHGKHSIRSLCIQDSQKVLQNKQSNCCLFGHGFLRMRLEMRVERFEAKGTKLLGCI
jgi:hypothetical protein